MSLGFKTKASGRLSFLFKIFTFVIIIFALDFSIGNVLRHFYFKQKSGMLYRSTYAIDSTRADVLVFGASTASHHYHPVPFEDKMDMTFYNAGMDGYSIFYHYSILKGILKRYTPKIVILDINLQDLKKEQESYDRMASLLPYYEYHPEIRSIVEMRSKYEKYKLLSKIYPFNSIIFTIAIGNTEGNKTRRNNNDQNGYVPLHRMWHKAVVTDSTVFDYELDTNKVNTFKKFVKDCVDSNIKLYIIVSPRYIKYYSRDISNILCHKIADENKVPFHSFSNDTYFLNHKELFADVGHLNDTGAFIYSNKVVDYLLANTPNPNSNTTSEHQQKK